VRKLQAVELARVPDAIKGFGHVKARNAQVAQAKWITLLNQWQKS
jgi:indolepyruvate ferredoxin oxidoreductase